MQLCTVLAIRERINIEINLTSSCDQVVSIQDDVGFRNARKLSFDNNGGPMS